MRGAFLFLDCAAYFSQVFAKGVTRIGCSFLEISCKRQLFPQRTSAFDRLCLLPLSLPDFARDRQQVIDALGSDKQTAIVVGENDIARFNQEVTKACGVQRGGITRVDPLRATRTSPITENRQTNMPELGRITMRAPDDDSG